LKFYVWLRVHGFCTRNFFLHFYGKNLEKFCRYKNLYYLCNVRLRDNGGYQTKQEQKFNLKNYDYESIKI